MTQILDLKKTKTLGIGVAVCFLFIHFFMLFMFYKNGVTPMVYFNIFSILFYLSMIPIIYKGFMRTYVVATYIEVVAHMSLAAYFTGWESGFQITLIGMSFLAFYSEYVSVHLKMRSIGSIPLSLIGMAAYLIVCVVDRYHEVQYPLPDDLVFSLQVYWGIVVFSITIFFLNLLVKTTSQSEALLADYVGHDQLTGLPNRYYMHDQLVLLSEGNKLNGRWIAMLDIDDFKKKNDEYGHNCGDYVLKELAQILQEESRKLTVSRWGGEEFLVISGEDGPNDISFGDMDDLRKSIEDHCFSFEGTCLKVTVTVGMARYEQSMSLREWINRADQKMYEGKRSGKNRVIA